MAHSDIKATTAYIREAARRRGIDPDIAVRVARSEGLGPGIYQSNARNKTGRREPSYGPFQLLVGGKGTGYPAGMGNDFMRRTGLDPRDHNTVREQIDFALDGALKNGWGAWYGAAKVGVGKRDGIRGRGQQYASANPGSMTDASPAPRSRMPSGQVAEHQGSGSGGAPGVVPAPSMPPYSPPQIPTFGSGPAVPTVGGRAPAVPTLAEREGGNIRTVSMTLPEGLSGTPKGIASENEIARMRARADALLGGELGPIQHPLQGVAHVAEKAFGAFGAMRADKKERERNEALEAQAEAKRQAQADFLAQSIDPELSGYDAETFRKMAALYPEMAEKLMEAQVTHNIGREAREWDRNFQIFNTERQIGRDQVSDEQWAYDAERQAHRDRVADGQWEHGAERQVGRDAASDAQFEAQEARQREQFMATHDLNREKHEFDTTKPPTPPSDVLEYEYYAEQERAAGREPQPFGVWQQAGKAAGATRISVDQQGEGKYAQVVGEGYGKRYLEIQNAAQVAQGQMNTLGAMENMTSQPGFYSGAGGETVMQLKRAGAALGFNPDGITSMETFNALSKQAALEQMGGSLGSGFSNADRDFVIDQVANLGNTPEGNRQLIGLLRTLNERKIQIAELARTYSEQQGRINEGFDAELQRFAEANPLFPPPQETQPAPQPAPGQIPQGSPYVQTPDGGQQGPSLEELIAERERRRQQQGRTTSGATGSW
jgi:hypothetical protein